MPAAYTNLYLEQGTDFIATITIDDVYGELYDLSSFSAASQMRKSYYSANATASFATTINVGSGSISLQLDSANTALIAPGRYVYDTVITNTQNNTKTRVLEGIIEVSPDVTR